MVFVFNSPGETIETVTGIATRAFTGLKPGVNEKNSGDYQESSITIDTLAMQGKQSVTTKTLTASLEHREEI